MGPMKTLSTLISILTLFILSASAQQGEIKIGWIGPLTGPSAVLGVDSLKAVQMAFDDVNAKGGVNGLKLKLFVEDDQYSTPKTLSAYQKLVSSDGVKFVFVLTYGGIFAINERAKKDGVVVVDPLDCNDRIGALNDHILCVAKTTESLGTLIADHVVEHTNTPVGMLYFESDPFPKETAESALQRLKERGVTPALYEGYAAGTTDFKSLIQRLRSAKVKSVIMYGYDEMGLLARQIRDLGLQPQLYSFATVTSPGFLQSAQGSADGIIIVNWVGEGGEPLKKFMQEFHAKEKRDPFIHISTLPSYDVAQILSKCLSSEAATDKAGVVDSKKLLECFYKTKDYRGISGTITMDSDGVTRSFNHILAKLRGSELVRIE